MKTKEANKKLECKWCGIKIKESQKGYGQGFLTGVFGYVYCSRRCMKQHIECK